jgi:hypothetical protein
MRGIDIRYFVPLHLNALERRPGLKSWLEDICSDLKPVLLKPEDWFEQAHTYHGNCRSGGGSVGKMEVETAGVRTPCGDPPSLMTGRWRRALKRGTDFYFRVDWEETWPLKEMFEPLLIFVVLPYRIKEPNIPKRARLLETLKRRLLHQRLVRNH